MNRISHHSRPVTAERDESGVIVETALVIPIFLVLLMGMIDIGIGVFQSSQATSAAADGARSAIIWDDDATELDVVGTPEHTRIAEAVAGRLVGQEHTFKVSCVTPDGSTVLCSDANPDTDRVKVAVTWKFSPFSPVGRAVASGTIRGEATMSIIRQPDGVSAAPVPPPTTPSTTTTSAPPPTTAPAPTTTIAGATTTAPPPTTTTAPPPVCDASTPDFAPTAIKVNGAGKTNNATSIRITATGPCGTVETWINGHIIIMTGGPVYEGIIPKGTLLKVGRNSVQVVSNSAVIFDGVTQAEK